MEFAVRPAGIADAPAVARIQVQAWRAAYQGIMPQAYLDDLDERQRAQWWTTAFSRPQEGSAAFAAVRDEDVVGFAICGPAHENQPGGELYAINVLPECWGLGIGSALLLRVESALTELGHRAALLWVATGNDSARQFYERHDWYSDFTERTELAFEVNVPVTRYRRDFA